ncbi:serine/threonine-protein kinase Chk2-like [Hydractinia symbiolongicarpus]|uniref:serine/threonine-protein kinase Chk2-like n=1 Tax=Hydractinia symbiolongicarpus TaxID=13093 RepID=UPI00254B9098|nr:serine/threonine-protein kinase Chk2-like [Hydractinia symbiolongicarpus]XP_057303660.1 serine/threonine-protein kinase Chk2-like [Hydractinia symbiolongicarpus]
MEDSTKTSSSPNQSHSLDSNTSNLLASGEIPISSTGRKRSLSSSSQYVKSSSDDSRLESQNSNSSNSQATTISLESGTSEIATNQTPLTYSSKSTNSSLGSSTSQATTLSLESNNSGIVTNPLPSNDISKGNSNIVTGPTWGLLTAVNNEYRNYNLKGNGPIQFGRHYNCEYKFPKKVKWNNKVVFFQLSVFHFTIYRVVDEQSPTGFTVYISDRSRHGTYLNGEKIGKGNSQPLTNCSKISLIYSNYETFMYFDINYHEAMLSKFPKELKEEYIVETVRLGEGTYGVVQRGFLKTTNEQVAIKIIQKTPSLCFVKDISYEANLMMGLKHPNIVEIKGFYESDENVCIVLECVDGGELFQYLKKYGALAESRCKDLFMELLQAVDFLHKNNIVHRDIKPENVLLTCKNIETAHVKLTDFGHSRIASEQSVLKTDVGTPNFRAPEIVRGLGYTKNVDLWSLGCILYACLSAELPFTMKDGMDALNASILSGVYDFESINWQHISFEAKELVRQLLTVDVNKRIKLHEALQHDWFKPALEQLCKKQKIDN